MAELRNFGPFAAESGGTPFRGVVLSILMTFLLSGALPYAFLFFGSLAWLYWVMVIGVLFLFAIELPKGRLLRPLVPYLAWLCFYLIWGLIVSPDTDWTFALRTLGTTLILGMSMAALTARPQYLRTLATVAQFAVIGNLVVLLFMVRSPAFAHLVDMMSPDAGRFELGVSRFGGLWGNPNMAGYVCLVVIILSVFARPLIAWIGRLGCLPLLYLTASRKSVLLFLLICFTYLVMVQRRNLKAWLGVTVTAMILAMVFTVSSGLQDTSRRAASDRRVSRLLDLTESETRAIGGVTRVDLFHDWVGKLPEEPWYGYGLQAMAGPFLDPKNPDRMLRPGLLPVGTHNTYLGVLIDTGPVGLIAFLAMLFYYAKATVLFPGPPTFRWALVSLLLCNLIILVVSHSHLFSFEGKCAFLLFFLLPGCPGLREACGWPTRLSRAAPFPFMPTPVPK